MRRLLHLLVILLTEQHHSGLGGVFGLFYAVGAPLPFREAKPWRMSLTYRFFNKFGALAQRLQKK